MTAPTAPRRFALARRPPARPATLAGLAVFAALVAVIAASAVWDPSGLLAPVSGLGLPLLGTGGAYRWAPLLVGLPILLAGTSVPVYLIARVGRPAITARWVFAVAWAALVGSAALATAAVGVVSVAPVLGASLAVGSAAAYAFATSGFAAVKFLLIGPLVAAAPALAFRLGARRLTASEEANTLPPAAAATAVAATVMFVVTLAAAVTFAAQWWRGGPVGYAFTGPVVAPTAASGVVGFLVGIGVFVGVFAWFFRGAHRRLAHQSTPASVAVVVWLAATVAGLVLGVVQAVVAAVPFSSPIPAAGADSWWIATTIVSLAAGLGYGAAVGAVAAIATGVAWCFPALVSGSGYRRRGRVVVAPLAVLLLAVPLLVGTNGAAGPESAPEAAASGAMERLQLISARGDAELPTIGDVTGRQVILRGVNVNQLIDYHLRDPAIPAVQPPTDADFAKMASMGFNVVRLGMSWSRLQPRRDEFDEGYLAQVRSTVTAAKAHGIYTVLDMHQDAWGNGLARPSEQCGGMTTPTTGWDGAPAWATITDGTLHCQFLARDLAPAVATAFSNFYTDRDGIQTQLVRTWAFVAAAFADEPAVAGYDLLNEPGIGANPPISSGLLLGRYYDAAITAIRVAEATGGGFPHLVFFEPSVLWSGLGFDALPPPGFTDDRQLVFAPHPYSESISMDQSFGLTIASIERNLAVSSRAAASYGAALWAGEWGWFGDPTRDGAKVQRLVAAQNRLGIGGAFWVWRQGCGSPETGDDATTSGNLIAVNCDTGALFGPPSSFAQPLSSAYPRAFPGRLETLESSPDGQALTFGATAGSGDGNCRLDVWVPGDAPPVLSTEGVTDPVATKVPGGWHITGCARNSYSVVVTRPGR